MYVSHMIMGHRRDATMDLAPADILDQSRAPQIIAGNATVQALGTLIFLARVYSRLFLTKGWKIEDSVLTSTWIVASIYSACQYGQVTCGAGNHVSSMKSPTDLVMLQQYAFVAQLMLVPALAFSKISICLFYYRVFDSDCRGRRMIMTLIIIMAGTSIPLLVKSVFQCSPIEVYWTELRPEGKCLNDLTLMYSYGTLNVLVDIGLIAIVFPRVISLNLNRRQKSALVGIVLLGWLAAIAGIVRMVRVGHTLAIYKSDPMWNAYDISIWTSTEIYVSLICAAAPGTKPLVSQIIPKLLGSAWTDKAQPSKAIPLPVEEKRRRPGTFAHYHTRSLSATGWNSMYGQYSQIGKGVDEEEKEEHMTVHERRPSQALVGIVKKVEARIETSNFK